MVIRYLIFLFCLLTLSSALLGDISYAQSNIHVVSCFDSSDPPGPGWNPVNDGVIDMKVKVTSKPFLSDDIWYVTVDAQKFDKGPEHANDTYKIYCDMIDIEHNNAIGHEMPMEKGYNGVNSRFYPQDIIEGRFGFLQVWSVESFRWQGWYKKIPPNRRN